MPSRTYGRYSPWGRLAAYRRQYDAVIDRLIDTVKADPDFESRDDVLTLLLRSTYEDGSAMSRRDIADELLTLLAAGHETTASTLAWVFERVIRHPDVLAKLEAEAATDGNEYRQATILEVQRVRTVIDFAGPARVRAHVRARRVGDSPGLLDHGRHRRTFTNAQDDYADPERFDPQRFIGKPAVDVVVHPVRRRYPALRRCGVRQRRDGRRAANGVAQLRDRDHHRARREGALPRRRLHAGGRRPHGRCAAGSPPLGLTCSAASAVSRFGSFQPARGKWQVYPFG